MRQIKGMQKSSSLSWDLGKGVNGVITPGVAAIKRESEEDERELDEGQKGGHTGDWWRGQITLRRIGQTYNTLSKSCHGECPNLQLAIGRH